MARRPSSTIGTRFAIGWPTAMASRISSRNYENELRKLSMKENERATMFTAKFNAIATNLPSWSDRNLRNAYYHAIAPRIRNQFVTAGRVPPDLFEPLVDAVEGFDTAYWADIEAQKYTRERGAKASTDKDDAKTSKSAKSTASTSAPTTSVTTSVTTTATRTDASKSKSQKPAKPGNSSNPRSEGSEPLPLGADGRLTTDERARRMKEGLCLYCGGKGHKSTECPKRKAKAAAATTTAPPPTGRAAISIEPEKAPAAQ